MLQASGIFAFSKKRFPVKVSLSFNRKILNPDRDLLNIKNRKELENEPAVKFILKKQKK